MRGFLGDERVQATQTTFEMNGPEVLTSRWAPSASTSPASSPQGLTSTTCTCSSSTRANVFMLQHLRRKLGIREDRFAIHMPAWATRARPHSAALDAALARGASGRAAGSC
jgi:hypothetical protein